MATTAEIEAQIERVEKQLAILLGNGISDIHFTARMGKCPPQHLAEQWVAETGLKVAGRIFVMPHRQPHNVILIHALEHYGEFPADWMLIGAEGVSGHVDYWSHSRLNKLYRQWLSNG